MLDKYSSTGVALLGLTIGSQIDEISTFTSNAREGSVDLGKLILVGLIMCGSLFTLVKFHFITSFMVKFIGKCTIHGVKLTKSHLSQPSGHLFFAAADLLILFSPHFALNYSASPFALISTAISCILWSLVTISLVDRTINDMTDLTPEQWEKARAIMAGEIPLKTTWREQQGRSVKSSVEEKINSTYLCEEKLSGLKSFEWSEIHQHRSEKSLWIVANGLVYDITSFYPRHPGGRKVILTMGGRDATDVLDEFHPHSVFKILPKFLIGKLSESKRSSNETDSDSGDSASVDSSMSEINDQIVQDHRKIRQVLLEFGLFDTDYDYYAAKCMAQGGVYVFALYLVLFCENWWLQQLSAILIGLCWQQMAFIGHDLGHNAVTHLQNVDNGLGVFLGNFLGGISIGWWKLSHNVHHINCNSITDDPDIQHMPVFAVDDSMLNSFFSTYHNKVFVFDFISKILLSFQHILFYPVMGLARFNLYLQSYLYYFANPYKIDGQLNYDVVLKYWELAGTTGFLSWLALLVSFLPTWKERLTFLFLSHAVSGILHVQICISHFSMDTYHGKFTKQVPEQIKKCKEGKSEVDVSVAGDKDNYAENWVLLQIRTTMNVENDPEWDFFHGGLNFQIEHHLFPRLPRHNLRLCSKMVKEMCSKHNVQHRSLSFIDCNKDLVGKLYETALAARKQKIDSRSFKDSEMYEAMNLIG